MKPKTGAEVRALLQNRTTDRPRAELPAVHIDGATATIRLYDAIDSWGEWWGMSAKELAAAVDALPSNITTIELLINSPGGDVFDGIAMVNVLRAHPARVVAVVQGIAASAASLIACAADEAIMSPNSTLMIHCAWGMCVGNADELVTYAALLEKIDDDIATIYVEKSGKTLDEVRELMKAETFFTAAEAVESGLADSIATDPAPSSEPAPSALLAPADIQAIAAALTTSLGIPIPSAGEREETTTDTTTPASSVDQEQASRLLATLTLTQGETNE